MRPCLEFRGVLFRSQHAQGEPAAGGGGDAAAAPPLRAAFRAPRVGRATADVDAVEVHPPVLRRRRARHPGGVVSRVKSAWLVAAAGVAALAGTLVLGRPGRAATPPQPRPGGTAERGPPPAAG